MIVRVGLLLLFLLALPSCVPKGIGRQSHSQQALEAKPSLVSTEGGASVARSNPQGPENSARSLTSAGQESDINGEISLDGSENTVFAESPWPTRGFETSPVNQGSEMIGFFVADQSRGLLLSVDKLGQAVLWEPRRARARTLFSLHRPLETVALDPEHRLLAIAGPSSVEVISALSGEVRVTLDRLKTRAASLQFQPKHAALLIGGVDGEVYRWKFAEPQSEKSLERYFGHSNVVSSALFHPLGRVFFTGDWSGALNAWLPYDQDDRFGGEYDKNLFGARAFSTQDTRIRASRRATSSIEHLAISSDGEALLVGGQDGTLEWWSVRGFSMRTSTPAHKGLMYGLAISPAGSRVATSGRDGKVQIWRLTDNKVAASNTVTYAIELVRTYESVGAVAIQFLDEDTLAEVLKDGQVTVVKITAL